MKIISLLLTITLFLPASVFAEVHPRAEEAIRDIFPGLDDYREDVRVQDGQEIGILTIFSRGNVLGRAVVLDEAGKIKPITFLVGIDTQSKVLAVHVLEYRDIFGSEIKRRSFLRQFKGKSLKDPLLIGRDIDAVTQATISSQAAASAVKKALKILKELKIGGQPIEESIK